MRGRNSDNSLLRKVLNWEPQVFTFQLKRKRLAEPVGTPMSDRHGIICSPGFECDVLELMQACGMVALSFDNLLLSQQCIFKFLRRAEPSPFIDLWQGYDNYHQQRRAEGSRVVQKTERAAHRLVSVRKHVEGTESVVIPWR